VENVLKINNMSRNNAKESNRNSKEKYNEHNSAINKNMKNTIDKDKDKKQEFRTLRSSEKEKNNIEALKESSDKKRNFPYELKSNFDSDKTTNNYNKRMIKTLINTEDNSVNLKTLNNKTYFQTPKSENSFANFAVDNVKNLQEIHPNKKFYQEILNSKDLEVTRNYKSSYAKNHTNSDVENHQEKNPQYEYSSDLFKPNLSNIKDIRPGERLYLQYMEKLPKKKQHQKKIIEEREKEEIKAAPFKPNILKTSQKIASKSPDRVKSNKIEDLLIHKGNKIKEKINQESAKKNIKEYETLPFYPSISEKSSIIATIKKRERLKELSGMKYIKQMNKSCDISQKQISKNQTESISSIPSDEEKYGNNNRNIKYHNLNMKNKILDSNPNNDKASFVSSDYTFTNMKENLNNKKTLYNLNQERNQTFENSQNELTIRTPRSKSRSYSSNSPVNIRKSNNRYKIKSKNNILANEDKKLELTPPKTPTRNHEIKIPSKNTMNLYKRSKTPLQNHHTINLNPENNIHDLLYIESDLIKKKKEEKEAQYMKEYYPFHPVMSESSKNLINRQETTTQFINRLMNSKKEADELIIIKRKKNSIKDQTDSFTGQLLFKPSINKSKLNFTNKPRTYENLDGYHDHKLISEKKKIQEEEMFNNLEKKKLWLESSMKSVLKMKIDKYKDIFDMLDSDKDGFISSRQIRLSALDADMLTNLTPLLEDLQKKGIKRNFKEFCLAVDKFLPIKIFSINQKK